MIDYVKGEVADLTPATVTIDCNGVGYLAHISLQTYSAIGHNKTAKIYIYESVRQDAFVLFGFINKHEREVFMHLISVSGVGPSTARVMLSSLSSKEVEVAIVSEDVNTLRSVKGIGIKTAQRIIVDLKEPRESCSTCFRARGCFGTGYAGLYSSKISKGSSKGSERTSKFYCGGYH